MKKIKQNKWTNEIKMVSFLSLLKSQHSNIALYKEQGSLAPWPHLLAGWNGGGGGTPVVFKIAGGFTRGMGIFQV